MSRLMLVLAIVLGAIGLALAVMNYASPGQMQVVGLTPDVAAILLVGGVLALGLGGVITALEQRAEEIVPTMPIRGLAPSVAATAAVAEVAKAVVTKTAETPAEPVKAAAASAVDALDKAKADIKSALQTPPPPMPQAAPTTPPPAPEPVAEAAVETAAAEEGDELYVVEEKAIRGRPARILSDGTVEAETDEGWMRFENLEHLDEYLDAEEAAKA